MTEKILKDQKIFEAAKKIAIARKEKKSTEGDMEKLISLIRKLDATSNENLSNLIADAIIESEKNISQSLLKPESTGTFINNDSSKNKYIPKIRDANIPVHFNGEQFSMKDLTKKIKQPLHYIFLTEGNGSDLHAFDSYEKIDTALEKENLIDTIRLEVNKQYANLYSTIIITNPDGSTSFGWIQDPPPVENFWPDAERPQVNAFFYEHINFDGEELELAPGRWIPNLVDIWMEWFLFWKTADWNDKISSIKVGDGTIVACEHIFGAGATLTLKGSVPTPHYTTAYSSFGRPYRRIDYWICQRRDIPSLVNMGWNDRISSVHHYH